MYGFPHPGLGDASAQPLSVGGVPMLPARDYPLPAERILIEDYKFPQSQDPAAYGITLNEEGLRFLDAVRDGIVPNTARGYETLLAWAGVGKAERLAAGLDAFQAWLDARYWASADAVGVPPEYRIMNPVTGGYHDMRTVTVTEDGPDPTEPGMRVFALSDGQRWRYPEPGYSPPAPRVRTGTLATYVLGPEQPGGTMREVVAVKYTTTYDSGPDDEGPWERYAAHLVPGQDPTAQYLYWADLSGAERALIYAALAPTGWAPDGAGNVVPVGPDGNTVIPSTPGGVTIVPAPGSTDPITIYPPGGGVQTIPTATSAPNAAPIVPPQSWWDQVVVPMNGAPAPGQPATIPTTDAPVVSQAGMGGFDLKTLAIGAGVALALFAVQRARRR